jgi:hypothetical protein
VNRGLFGFGRSLVTTADTMNAIVTINCLDGARDRRVPRVSVKKRASTGAPGAACAGRSK